jgi:hypothetical protein
MNTIMNRKIKGKWRNVKREGEEGRREELKGVQSV